MFFHGILHLEDQIPVKPGKASVRIQNGEPLLSLVPSQHLVMIVRLFCLFGSWAGGSTARHHGLLGDIFFDLH